MRSPDRACARASVHPHTCPYTRIPRGIIASTGSEYFQSRSWRM